MEKVKRRLVVFLVLAMLICPMFIYPAAAGRNKKRWQQLRSDENEIRTRVRTRTRTSQSRSKKQERKPHIIFIMADDLGWNDVSYHGSEIQTPVIDSLAMSGVRLENYYTQAVCSPTRASLMTGRYQTRTGIDRVLDASEVGCMPVHLTTLPERLKVYGYNTHLVGKWHLGFSRKACLPTRRGFDSFLVKCPLTLREFNCESCNIHTSTPQVCLNPSGPYTGYVDHYTREKVAVFNNRTYDGYDFHKDEEPSWLYEDRYSTNVYTKEAEKIIKRYAKKKKPMFLFLSLQAVHTPNQAPQKFIKYYASRIQGDEQRLSHAAMTTCMDTAIGKIRDTLKKNKMWHNTVLIFSSDNGGAYAHGSDNYPLRGSKGNYREGGIRVVSFITSPLIPVGTRGSLYRGLMGVADWFPTLVDGVAGGSTKYLAIDGINMWDNLRNGIPSDRNEYVFSVGGDCNWQPGDIVQNLPLYGTIRVGAWKLILGHITQKPHKMATNSEDQEMYLYNLQNDPGEMNNLYSTHYLVFYSLLQRLRYHCRTKIPYVPLEESELSDPKFHGGVFRPWMDLVESPAGIL